MSAKIRLMSKKKSLIISGDLKLVNLIISFANKDAVIYPKLGGSLSSRVFNLVFPKVELDLTHSSVSKDTVMKILMLLRG